MGMHWSIKGLAEQRVMEDMIERAMVRTSDALRRELVAVLEARAVDLEPQDFWEAICRGEHRC